MVKIKNEINNNFETIKKYIKGKLYKLDKLGPKDIVKTILETLLLRISKRNWTHMDLKRGGYSC